jgi:hypothetical protein
MLSESEVLTTIKVVARNLPNGCNIGITTSNQKLPDYLSSSKCFQICKTRPSFCSTFYKDKSGDSSFEEFCPAGLKICKRTVSTNTKYGDICLYGIINFNTEFVSKEIKNLPRKIKKEAKGTIDELSTSRFDEAKCINELQYVYDVLESLLVGRKGVAIQGISHQFFTPLQGAMSDVQNIINNEHVEESAKRLSLNFEIISKISSEVQLLLSSTHEFNSSMLRKVSVHSAINNIFEMLKSTAIAQSA